MNSPGYFPNISYFLKVHLPEEFFFKLFLPVASLRTNHFLFQIHRKTYKDNVQFSSLISRTHKKNCTWPQNTRHRMYRRPTQSFNVYDSKRAARRRISLRGQIQRGKRMASKSTAPALTRAKAQPREAGAREA